MLLADDYDEIVLVAREQVEGGAHLLDICCALTERPDEDEQMRQVVRRLAQSIEAPLVIDSTEPKVLEVALNNYPGRAVSTPCIWSRGARRWIRSCRSRASTARRWLR